LEQTITKKKAIKQGAMQQLLTPPHKGDKRLPGFSGEWERVKVEKVINVGRGGSPRPIQDYITTYSIGVNWIKIGDTSRYSKYINSSKEKIIPEGVQFSRSVSVGDFLLSNSMSFGRPYILKIDGCIHDGWLVLQNYQDSFDREFLYYTLMSKDIFDQYLAKASGSGVLNLNKELVKVVELNRPKDLDEQKAIAQILSDMDAEITQLETKKAKYQAIKQGMMQELLTGKTRLI
jgi:type I restriction enzyme S subunit